MVIGYLVAASGLPLMLDLAEEFFAEQVAKSDPASAMALNAALASLSAAVGLLIARPAGSYISGMNIVAVLAVNAALSLIAVFLRRRASRLFPTSAEAYETDTVARNHSWMQLRLRIRQAASLGIVSPLTSGVLALVTTIYGTYLALFTANATGDHNLNLAICLACVGLGAVAGPQLARRLHGLSPRATLMLAWMAAAESAILLALAGVIFLGTGGYTLLITGMLGLAGLGACATGMLTLVRTERQVRLHGKTFVFAVGWSHSFAAAGALLGAWLGLLLGVAQQPPLGLTVSAILAGIFAGACARSDRSRRASQEESGVR